MTPEPVAVAFANTRSSSKCDRIATLAQWRAWVNGWPGLRAVGRRIDAEGLIALRHVRDDVQRLLRAGDGAAAARLTELAGRRPRHEIRWRAGRPVLYVADPGDPAAAIAHHLARTAIDLLLTGLPLGTCQGHDCLQVFVASRRDRRWCDSAICGNRTRVSAHRRKALQRKLKPRA
jgi:predicted RNA-binding Zn ribbon-like protein